jgi:hypothetical protein
LTGSPIAAQFHQDRALPRRARVWFPSQNCLSILRKIPARTTGIDGGNFVVACGGQLDRQWSGATEARLRELDAEPLLYERAKPSLEGIGPLHLTPLALLDHLAALVPPPRLHVTALLRRVRANDRLSEISVVTATVS